MPKSTQPSVILPTNLSKVVFNGSQIIPKPRNLSKIPLFPLKIRVKTTENKDIKPEDAPSDKIQPEGEQKPEEPQGKSISGMVNQEFAAMLEGMGYSKNVREKALL